MSEPLDGAQISAADPGAAVSAQSVAPKRPVWRKLLRGIAFMPLGVFPLVFLTWLLGGIGAGIGSLAILGAFIQGYNGEPVFGPPRPEPVSTAIAAVPAMPSPIKRRRGLWWKIPLSIVGILFGLLVMIATLVTPDAPVEQIADGGNPKGVSTPAVTPSPSPVKKPKPETIEGRVGEANVTRAGNFLLVRTKIGTVWSDKWIIIEAAQRLFNIGKWASVDVAQRTPGTKLALQVYAETRDQYGNVGDSLILILAIDPAKFALINWGNFSPEYLLDLVEIEQLWPAANKAAIEYCRDTSRASFSPSFCVQAARFVR